MNLLLHSLAHPSIVGGWSSLWFARLDHVRALSDPGRWSWGSFLSLVFNSIDPSQAFGERRLQALDVVVVVVHLLLQVADTQTHGLVVTSEKVDIRVVKAALCQGLGKQEAVGETLVAQFPQV